MDNETESERKISKTQIYLFLLAGSFLAFSTTMNYGYVDTLLALIGGSVFISNIVTFRYIDTSENDERKHNLSIILVGCLAAGLFMIPPNTFIYFTNDSFGIELLLLSMLVSFLTGGIIGFLIDYRSDEDEMMVFETSK